MYSLFSSNDKNESLYLLKSGMTSLEEAMKALEECNMPYCQIEKFDIPEDKKTTADELLKQNIWKYAGYIGIYGRYTLIATKHYGEITTYRNTQPSGRLIDVDEVRENFIDKVHSILSDDPTKDRANDIINAFDHLPTIKYH